MSNKLVIEYRKRLLEEYKKLCVKRAVYSANANFDAYDEVRLKEVKIKNIAMIYGLYLQYIKHDYKTGEILIYVNGHKHYF